MQEEQKARSVLDWTIADARAHVLSMHIPCTVPATSDGVKGSVTFTRSSLVFSGGGIVKGCDLSVLRTLDIVDGNTLVVGYSAGGEMKSFKLEFEPMQNLHPQVNYSGRAYTLAELILDIRPDIAVAGKRKVSDEEYEERIRKARELIRSWKKPEEHFYDKAFDEYADVIIGPDAIGNSTQDALRAILIYEGDKKRAEFDYIFPGDKEDAKRDAKASRDRLVKDGMPIPSDL